MVLGVTHWTLGIWAITSSYNTSYPSFNTYDTDLDRHHRYLAVPKDDSQDDVHAIDSVLSAWEIDALDDHSTIGELFVLMPHTRSFPTDGLGGKSLVIFSYIPHCLTFFLSFSLSFLHHQVPVAC